MELFKHRSVIACMKASYDAMTSEPAHILKKTWWAVLVYAIATTLCLYFRIPNKGLHDWGEANQLASFVLQTVIYLLSAAASILAGTAYWGWINKRPFLRNLRRYFAVNLVIGIVVCAIAFAASFANQLLTSDLARVAEVIIATVVAFIVLLPFGYLLPHLMLLGKGEKSRPWRSYITGLRHFGAIFMLSFLCSIITSLVACVLFIPAAILCGAQTISQLGALDGDPLGTPAYFTPLLLAVTAAIIFLFFYVSAWLTLAYAHLYGSIRTQEKERSNIMQIQANKI